MEAEIKICIRDVATIHGIDNVPQWTIERLSYLTEPFCQIA